MSEKILDPELKRKLIQIYKSRDQISQWRFKELALLLSTSQYYKITKLLQTLGVINDSKIDWEKFKKILEEA